MRVILNSDITRQHALARGSLDRHATVLLEACRDHGHVVTLPRTTIYEFRHQQELERTRKVAELLKAVGLLDELGIEHGQIDVEAHVQQEELVDLVRASGAQVEVAEPSHSELIAAHDRACLHAPPAIANAKSDEMRDLVVWEIALRYASQEPTLLVSRDAVHSGPLGEDEASAHGLQRARTIEDALDILEVETPAKVVFRELLQAVWDDLRAAGVDIPGGPDLRRIREPRFRQGEGGLEEASAVVRLGTARDSEPEARVRFTIRGPRIVQVSMYSTQASETAVAIELNVAREWNASASDFDARLQDLREVLESQ